MNWVIALMREHWPSDGNQKAVVAGYSAFATQFPRTLADIALRNNVFSNSGPVADLYEAGIAEGRRRAALEIFKLANVPPEQLFKALERKG